MSLYFGQSVYVVCVVSLLKFPLLLNFLVFRGRFIITVVVVFS